MNDTLPDSIFCSGDSISHYVTPQKKKGYWLFGLRYGCGSGRIPSVGKTEIAATSTGIDNTTVFAVLLPETPQQFATVYSLTTTLDLVAQGALPSSFLQDDLLLSTPSPLLVKASSGAERTAIHHRTSHGSR